MLRLLKSLLRPSHVLIALIAMGVGAVHTPRAHAALDPAFPVFVGLPDLFASTLNVSYNSTTEVFAVSGIPFSFEVNGLLGTDYDMSAFTGNPTYSIQLEIDSSTGSVSPGGLLIVTGSITGIPAHPSSVNLLEGTIKSFGYGPVIPGSGDAKFQLTFDNLKGSLSPLYQSGEAFVLLSAEGSAGATKYGGDFQTSFNFGDAASKADNWGELVPEPSSLSLLSLGLAGMTAVYRRRLRLRRVITSAEPA